MPPLRGWSRIRLFHTAAERLIHRWIDQSVIAARFLKVSPANAREIALDRVDGLARFVTKPRGLRLNTCRKVALQS
jgi:hypothetical protein